LSADEEPTFLTDAMLGGLTRWLRMLGFDSAHRSQGADPELIRQALAERRFVVTRDRRLALEWRVEGILLVRSDGALAQLWEVDRELALARFARPFTRCSRCNAVLVLVPVAEVATRVPAQVLAAGTDVRLCPGCARVYWEGSHTERMRHVLTKSLGWFATESEECGS
jgi:uncharacterized protein with PIN domain